MAATGRASDDKAGQSILAVPTSTSPHAAGYTPTVYFYRTDNANPGTFFDADAVRDSLAKALRRVLPLAGRLGVDDATGRVQIDCTGEGAVFVTARSDTTPRRAPQRVRPVRRHARPPRATHPHHPTRVVTRLRCGGVVLGLALHHSVSSTLTWASIARYCPPNPPAVTRPCRHASTQLLAARQTPMVLYDHPEYKAEPTPAAHAVTRENLRERHHHAEQAQVTSLKSRCAGASTFRAVVALVWQCAVAVHDEALLDDRHACTPRAAAAAGLLWERGDPDVGVGDGGGGGGEPGRVRGERALAATSQETTTRGSGRHEFPRSGISRAHLRAISWMGMSLHDSDFGWGAPVFMGPALMYYSGFVYVMQAPGKDGAPESMPEFRKVFAEELGTARDVV
ncbi:hypothetical protein HU200_005731 [Digitaria exilis]|uniref:Uncharacterized protein n=1 Tax=Digitaria exilis TaxID=1010633 RepID=A0A835KW79_9POAL|nr:hypothetical protein HU200_005731 [Digitaria exilis]